MGNDITSVDASGKANEENSSSRRRFVGQAYLHRRDPDDTPSYAHLTAPQPSLELATTPDLGDYEEFKRHVFDLLGLNLDLYKEGQMRRRIGTLIGRRKSSSYEEYALRLAQDEAELELFSNYLTINVTDFFRDEALWRTFREEIVPKLISRFAAPRFGGDGDGNGGGGAGNNNGGGNSAGVVRDGGARRFVDPSGTRSDGKFTVWCSACSTGEEAYSLAMVLSRFIPLDSLHIMASDVDERVLRIAREGRFAAQAVEHVPDDMKERFFQPDEEGYRVSEELRNCVEFFKLDLLRDGYPKGCHLITCRNVLIYFTAQAKDSVFANYAQSLVPGGILFMGRTEQIVNWKRSAFVKLASCFYERRAN